MTRVLACRLCNAVLGVRLLVIVGWLDQDRRVYSIRIMISFLGSYLSNTIQFRTVTVYPCC